MKVRDYDKEIEKLLLNDEDTHGKYKYKFFSELQRLVYVSHGPSVYRSALNLPRPYEEILNPMTKTSTQKYMPYWELHYYEDGFTDSFGADMHWFRNDADADKKEKHIYFTFKSKVGDFYKKMMLVDRYKIKTPNGNEWVEKVPIGDDKNSRVDTEYPKHPAVTSTFMFQIYLYILDDEQDNFDFFKHLLPPEIWNCLSEHGKKTPITPNPSMLPQVMFLSNLSIYATKTENVNSIVCLDRFTTLRAPSIKGNIFLNDNANVNISADMIGPAQGVKSHLGEGSIFGINSEVNSVSLGSNTVICGKTSLDFDTIVNDGCVIGNGVKISRGQTVMASQKITATLPLSLSIMRNAAMFSLEDFLRLSEVRRHLLLSGEIS